MISNKEAKAFLSKNKYYKVTKKDVESFQKILSKAPGGVGHGPKGIMGKKPKTAHLHLTFALFTSLVTP